MLKQAAEKILGQILSNFQRRLFAVFAMIVNRCRVARLDRIGDPLDRILGERASQMNKAARPVSVEGGRIFQCIAASACIPRTTTGLGYHFVARSPAE